MIFAQAFRVQFFAKTLIELHVSIPRLIHTVVLTVKYYGLHCKRCVVCKVAIKLTLIIDPTQVLLCLSCSKHN